MGRKSSFAQTMVRAQRETEKQRVSQVREMERRQTQAAKNAEKARKDYEAADQKERVRLYNESRIAQVNLQNEQLGQNIAQLNALLSDSLLVDSYINLQSLKQASVLPKFSPGPLAIAMPPPVPQMYVPPGLTGMQKFFPGAKEKYAQEVKSAQDLYKAHVVEHSLRERDRLQKLADAKTIFDRQIVEIQQKTASQHDELDKFQSAFDIGSPDAIVNYFSLVLTSSTYPDNFPQHTRVAYVPESKQLVVECSLPSIEIIPQISVYKYVKAKDEIVTTLRSLPQQKALYTSIVTQVTLRTIYELFCADRKEYVDTIVFNGYVETIDRGTGHRERICLITVRTSRDVFTALNLSRVEPQACLKVLNASLSKSPTELAPVRPVLEFDMVDPRFIEESDVLSGLDQRPNLMELTPSEFESLISNLFKKMGLETRQTQASRDGGVDCVAFDPRPIFGGKVVIQAKRYKHTVGVSAVRDLYGTMQNEGASKGILVTTSGYGKASFEFAEGKPLELLSGSNLLYLLAEHADIEAKIEMPDDWKDSVPDSGDH